MIDWQASFSILTKAGVAVYILRGVAFSLVISVCAVVVSLLIGSVLALMRNYCSGPTRIFKRIATAYIELFRNTPLLFWIFICLVFCPVPGFFTHRMLSLTSVEVRILFRAFVALVLFESSIMAEIIRGGLNSVAAGQFEAGHSQGFSTVQILRYIVLPQAYRAVVPTLLSQVISTIKDSSYLANVAVIELMSRVRQILATSNMYNGAGTQLVSDVFVLFGIAFIIYFVINFALSCVVRSLQHPRPRRSARPEPTAQTAQ